MPPLSLPTIHLITPALAEANNGNWQTAYRWSKFLSKRYNVLTTKEWQPSPPTNPSSFMPKASPEMMIALHARRSASAIEDFAKTGQPIAVVLTGTDLYRDIHHDASAVRSLELAHRLVVLHEQGVRDLPERFRSKTRVIFQSARKLVPVPQASAQGPRHVFTLALVGHIRAEKDPMTALRAMQALRASGVISNKATRLIHIGSDKDETLGHKFRELAATLPEIYLKGSLSNPRTRQLIKRCDALVLPSIMEGGANVLIEAVMSGVPVIASRISGSVGMLGQDYLGYFEVGQALDLAKLIARCRDDSNFLALLKAQCEKRAKLFEPALEKSKVNALADELIRFHC